MDSFLWPKGKQPSPLINGGHNISICIIMCHSMERAYSHGFIAKGEQVSFDWEYFLLHYLKENLSKFRLHTINVLYIH